MPAVQSDDNLGPETLGQGDHGGVRTPERKIDVLLDEFADPWPILGDRCLDVEVFKPTEETGLGRGASTALDQVGGLGDTERRNDEAETRRL